MLESVKISGYRSCLNTVFNPQPDLSVLIGPNGSGKTNVLKAILLLQKMTLGPARAVKDGFDTVSESKLRFKLMLEEKRSILTVDAYLRADENNNDLVLDYAPSWYVKDYTGSSKRFKVPFWLGADIGPQFLRFKMFRHSRSPRIMTPYGPFDSKFTNGFIKMTNLFRRITYYSAGQFVNSSECPVSFEVEQNGDRKIGVRLRGHGKFLFNLYDNWRSSTETYQKFLSVVRGDGIGLVDEIGFKEVETSMTDVRVQSGGGVEQRKRERNLVIPQFHIGGNTLSPNQLSEGTFRTLNLVFNIMADNSSILLIEEPEVCVHQGLLSSLVELIKIYSEQKQIIISTHSDFILDQVEPRNVYKVLLPPETGTEVVQVEESLSASELTALKTYLSEEGNLGDYWRDGGFD